MIACHFKVKIDGDEAPHDFLPCYVMSYLTYLHDRFMLRGRRRGPLSPSTLLLLRTLESLPDPPARLFPS